MNTSRRQLDALTGIRFFLAIWVVVYHQANSLLSSVGGPAEVHRVIECLVRTGYSAVSAFFVLSGFVLTYNYDLGTLMKARNAMRFGIARFSRIYPAYAAGLLMLIPLGIYRIAAGVDAGPTHGTGKFLLSVVLLQAWVPSAALSWNYPGWSLSNEAFFYALLPVIGIWIVQATKGPARQAVGRLLGLAGVFWILSLAMPVFAIVYPIPNFGNVPAVIRESIPGSRTWTDLICYNPLLRLPEFCIGVVLALLYRLIPARSRLWGRGALFYLPAIAVILLVLANGDRIPYPAMHDGLLAPAYAAMIFGFALEGGILSRFLSLPALVFLGGASYTLYILHAPMTMWMNIGFRRILHLVPFGMLWFVCYVVLVVGLTALFFWAAEEPMHRWLRARLNRWAESRQADVSVAHN